MKFFISWMIASHQRVAPFSWSIPTAYSTVFGTLSLYLWVFIEYHFVLDIIWSLLFKKYLIHHANYGSSKILFSTAYSAICTGYESLISLSLIHLVLPYFQWMQTSHPLIVFFLFLVPLLGMTNVFFYNVCVPLVLVTMMDSISTNWLPSWSTCANRFSAIKLSIIAATYTSQYSTSYILKSRMGFS